MELSVRLFAGLRERAGTGELLLTDLPERLDLAGLKRELERRLPALGALGHVAGVLANERIDETRELRAGDVIALLPPVSGGAPAAADEDLSAGVFALSAAELDVAALLARVAHPSCGAVALFSGTARDVARGRAVRELEYEAFDEMAGPEMARIFARCREACDADGTLRMLVVHRTGVVPVGRPAVVVAAASAHRDAAFRAARFLIDELKRTLPVWKKERYFDGETWIGEGS